MAAQKKTTTKKPAQAKKQTAKNTQKPKSETPRGTAVFEQKQRKQRDPDALIHQFIPCIFVILAVILCVFLAVRSNEAAGKLGGFIRMCLYGLFGWGAWLLPVFCILSALCWKRAVSEDGIGALFGFSLSSVVVLSALLHTIVVSDTELVYNPVTLFVGGEGIVSAGGAVGGFISCILIGSIQKAATYILLISGAVVLVMFTLRLTPKTIMLYVRYKRAMARERAIARDEALAEEYERRSEQYEQRYSEQ
ncbi:MAG: DNA translocase FtsK 4TM domain-containing protein, partial [Clostridia bacterium]|nr:DNA translocase FtsK 4TM domain-containing protein [Clostridia bacterium]